MRVRVFPLPDVLDVPRAWFHGNTFLSRSADGLHLLFPAGEQFFIRSVRHYLDRIDDPVLRARIKAFAGQEAQHGRAHEATFRILEAQGFEVKSLLAWYEKLAFERIEPAVPPVLRLSVTVALEHFTATLATEALEQGFLDDVPTLYGELLRWHACEEIEHKSVAFDVFQEVDGRYVVRIAGLVAASTLLVWFWNRAARHLLEQEPGYTRRRMKEERAQAHAQGRGRSFIGRAILSYLRPGFHPDDIDNRGLAADWLREHGFAV